jgi:hypothetical protein
MRIATPAAAPAVAQTTETKAPAVTTAAQPAATADVKSAVATAAKPAVGLVKDDAFTILPYPHPHPKPGPFPLPHPMPPPFPGQDTHTRNVQAKQLDQIAHGLRNGSITAQEAEGLLKEQTKIADYQKQAMSDGFLSQEERLRLDVMQAGAALNTYQAANNGDRNNSFFDGNAQRQAHQLNQIAAGRRSGNITNSEAGHLLRDQVEIADARGDADSFGEHLEVNRKLGAADRDINYHSQRGTQPHFEPLPWPRPQPLPFPKPQPLPFPIPGPIVTLPTPVPGPITTLPAPAPSKPDLHILPFRGPINA